LHHLAQALRIDQAHAFDCTPLDGGIKSCCAHGGFLSFDGFKA
jgi:hypothetical protein